MPAAAVQARTPRFRARRWARSCDSNRRQKGAYATCKICEPWIISPEPLKTLMGKGVAVAGCGETSNHFNAETPRNPRLDCFYLSRRLGVEIGLCIATVPCAATRADGARGWR